MAGCRTAEPHHAVHMGQLNGKRICGKPVGFDFMTAQRPDHEGKCPTDFKPCNSGDPTNVICMRTLGKSDQEFYNDCPINSIKLVSRDADLKGNNLELSEDLILEF